MGSPISGYRANVHNPYINIKFGSINLTWRNDRRDWNRPDFFTSLTHKRMVEKASSMTINITYVPRVNEDPNMIEYEILNSGGICIVQYGDLISGVSRAYKARVINYTVQVESGYLGYTFELMTAAVSYNFGNFTPNPSKLSGDDATLENFVEILKSAAKLTEDSYDFVDPTNVLSTSKSFKGGDIIFDNSCKNISPILFIIRALKMIQPSQEGRYYALEIDDSVQYGVQKGKLRVVEVNTKKKQIALTFEWGTKEGTVLSWSPAFKGAKGLSTVQNSAARLLEDKRLYSTVDARTGSIATVEIPDGYYEDDKDTVSEVNSKLSSLLDFASTGDTLFKTKMITGLNKFAEVAGYAYTGTLRVLGESSPVRLGETVISLTPILRGKAHHSQGDYVVIGCTDTVDSQGFTTTYNLVRQAESGDEQYTKYSGKGYYREGSPTKDCVWVNGTFVPIEEFGSESYDKGGT